MSSTDSSSKQDDTPAWEWGLGLFVIPPLGALAGVFVAASLFGDSGGMLTWVLGIAGGFVALMIGALVLPQFRSAEEREDDAPADRASGHDTSTPNPAPNGVESVNSASPESSEGTSGDAPEETRGPSVLEERSPEAVNEEEQADIQSIPLRFFLDEEGSPMSLSVVYDADGPNELGVALGTFESRDDAMSAVEQVRRTLEGQTRRWANVAHAMLAIQPFALELPGNLGLPGSSDGQVQPHSADEMRFSDEAREAEHAHGSEDGVVAQVLDSAVFTEQRRRARRTSLSDEQIASLLRRLMSTPGHRIYQSSAAEALEVPVFQLPGALPVAQRLLNVDQYPVLYRDPDSLEIVLDLDLLQEQFGVIT